MRFNVTFEHWTDADAEHGDTDKRGFLCESVSLRDALDEIADARGTMCSLVAVQPSSYPVCAGDWVTAIFGPDWETGINRTFSIHACGNLTASSAKRIARLMTCEL